MVKIGNMLNNKNNKVCISTKKVKKICISTIFVELQLFGVPIIKSMKIAMFFQPLNENESAPRYMK